MASQSGQSRSAKRFEGKPTPLDALDLYNLKHTLERLNATLNVARVSADLGFLRHARRELFPLPLVDRPHSHNAHDVFPELRSRPAVGLRGKRVGLVASGGGGAAAATVGAARAFEEAGIQPELITGCSGGAIWTSMWAAGLDAHEMANFSLSWRASDYLDIQWARMPRFALSALKGFTGLAKGKAIEHLFNDWMWSLPVGDTQIPITTIVYNMDLGEVDYFGTQETPDLTIGELVRIAIALPLFIESVEVNGHLFVDGGIIDLLPTQPFLEDGGFDHVFGLNFMLPQKLQADDITGWEQSPMGILKGSRQLEQGYHLEFARRSKDALGESLTIVDPVDYSLLRGVSFYDLFIDRRRWPEIMHAGYEATSEALKPFRASRRKPRPRPVTA